MAMKRRSNQNLEQGGHVSYHFAGIGKAGFDTLNFIAEIPEKMA